VAKRGERDRERGRRDGATRLAAETERQAVAPPAVTERSVFVPVEGDEPPRSTATRRGSTPTRGRRPPGPKATRPVGRRDPLAGQCRRNGRIERVRRVKQIGRVERVGRDGSAASGRRGIRAGDRLVAAVAGSELVALDAETGERAFSVTEAWPDGGDGAADRVAVDGEGVWVAVESEGEGEVDGGSEEPVATLVRFGPSGERRAERSVSVDVDWLVAVDETLVVGSAGGER